MMSNWNKFVVLHHFWQQLLFKVSAAAKHFYLGVVQSIHFGDTQFFFILSSRLLWPSKDNGIFYRGHNLHPPATSFQHEEKQFLLHR